ncbi:hypothetical protein PVK06_048981 [Gossypium arboreum]|uniref:Uncharacterized protein n=1 Tax=Gossypium arboreum TaxID=29729 RepID=A0ABR0MHX5_GOSAR|nr:hypothetical protein PVK06_048981 [Gossypium arboreum]
MPGSGRNLRDDWGSNLRNHINPIFGFNLGGSQITPDLNLIGSSSGMDRLNMEHDIEENPIVNVEWKKRPKIYELIPNASDLSDSLGIIV